jgi:Tol biopolymer transport system component
MAEQLTDDGLVYSDPKLGPRNDRVIVTGNGPSGSALFVIDLGTKQQYDLSALGSGRAGGLNLGYDATWSPDGRHVLFSLTVDDGYKYVASDLYVVDPDGANLVRLTDDGSVKVHVDWSERDELAFENAEGQIVIAKINMFAPKRFR